MKRVIVDHSYNIENHIWWKLWIDGKILEKSLHNRNAHYENKYNIKQYIKQTLNYSKESK